MMLLKGEYLRKINISFYFLDWKAIARFFRKM
jgi:hypothetical protein